MFMERLGDASYRNRLSRKKLGSSAIFQKTSKVTIAEIPSPARIREHRGISLELFNPSLIDKLRDAGCQRGEIVVFPRTIKLLGE